jgi:hypothetical protein
MKRSVVLSLLLFSGTLLHGQAAFEAQVIDANISIGYGLAIGDVNGDNKPDILLADKKQFVWYRNGDWKRFVLVENLTASDNVCIAARDIDGDGKVEIAVGAQWNPGETSDTTKSGSVHYLTRPSDPTQPWTAIQLHHEPTVHRMKWVMAAPGQFRLIVVPLHGRGNVNGEGTPVKILAYRPPKGKKEKWTYETVDQSMHLTHNLDIVTRGKAEAILVGGKEGVKMFAFEKNKWSTIGWTSKKSQFGEIRRNRSGLTAGIEPMHGNSVTAYTYDGTKTVVDSTLVQGHALAVADLLGIQQDQIIAGWREPDVNGKTGIRIYVHGLNGWQPQWLDENGIACEDLVVADLNRDSKPDVIAAGRASKNLKVYWNRNK